MQRLRGNTWDHTRGADPMFATAARFPETVGRDVEIYWDKRSLQAFADYPIDVLASEYDLIVVDHPHVGAVAQEGTLLSIDEYAAPDVLSELQRDSVGQSHDSYVIGGHLWALAIDAACQVAAYRHDRLERPPATWAEVEQLATEGEVLWPLKPVDSICSFQTLAANQGTPCGTDGRFIDEDSGVAVLERMRSIARLLPAECFSMNPIEALEQLSTDGTAAYCPLLFGYSNYARPGYRDFPVHFTDIPAQDTLPRGSILGGAGLAVSARTREPELAVEYALWVASADVQRTIYFDSGGQSAHRAAWEDDRTNALSNGYFRSTRQTMDLTWVRPRHAGFIEFQDRAGDLICAYLRGADDAAVSVIAALNDGYQGTRR